VDAHAGAFGENEQLRVEEPGTVSHLRQELAGAVGSNRLEPALGVREPRAEHDVQDRVVRARDELTLRAADHARAARKAGSDGEIAVPGEQRRDERQERRQLRREVDVHVGEHLRVARAPDGVECAPPPLHIEAHRSNGSELCGESRCDLPGPVGAAVVGDRHPGREREPFGQEVMEAADAFLQPHGLVEHGDHDLDLGRVVRGGHRLDSRCRELGCRGNTHAEQCPAHPLQRPEREL
jgi:hypothetical protein